MEVWDIYDAAGRLTGRTHRRGRPLPPGDYHLAVTITVVNSLKQVLCTLRSMKKTVFPGFWENPGGGALSGETSPQAAARELMEETGICASPEELVFLSRRRAEGFFMDVYGLVRDIPADQLVLQPEEVEKARWFPIDQWEQKARAREILAGDYTDEFFAAVRKLAK